MFLDEQLLLIANKVDITDEIQINRCCVDIVGICLENIRKNIKDNDGEDVIIAQFNRVNNTYKSVAKMLAKSGKHFLDIEGFKNYINSTELKGIIK